MMLVSTLRRPRWAIPITTSSVSWSAASERTASSSGIIVSAPSSENRLWPMYLVWMNCSRASASLSFSKMRFLRAVSMGSRNCCGSIRSMSQRFSAGEEMCMNSLPTCPV